MESEQTKTSVNLGPYFPRPVAVMVSAILLSLLFIFSKPISYAARPQLLELAAIYVVIFWLMFVPLAGSLTVQGNHLLIKRFMRSRLQIDLRSTKAIEVGAFETGWGFPGNGLRVLLNDGRTVTYQLVTPPAALPLQMKRIVSQYPQIEVVRSGVGSRGQFEWQPIEDAEPCKEVMPRMYYLISLTAYAAGSWAAFVRLSPKSAALVACLVFATVAGLRWRVGGNRQRTIFFAALLHDAVSYSAVFAILYLVLRRGR